MTSKAQLYSELPLLLSNRPKHHSVSFLHHQIAHRNLLLFRWQIFHIRTQSVVLKLTCTQRMHSSNGVQAVSHSWLLFYFYFFLKIANEKHPKSWQCIRKYLHSVFPCQRTSANFQYLNKWHGWAWFLSSHHNLFFFNGSRGIHSMNELERSQKSDVHTRTQQKVIRANQECSQECLLIKTNYFLIKQSRFWLSEL